MRSPRKIKKAANTLISIDIASIPDGLDVQEWMRIFRESGRLFWDSRNGGLPPQVLVRHNKRIKLIKK